MTEKNLWENLKLKQPSSINPPEKILESQCDILRKLTNGWVVAKIAKYDGKTSSDHETSSDHKFDLKTLLINMVSLPQESESEPEPEPEPFNVQQDLGEVGDNSFSFEFYITSPHAPHYKFRIMFLNYSLEFYPVKLVLDECIAKSIGETGYILRCESEEAFIDALDRIFSSSEVERVINSLNMFAYHRENRTLKTAQ